MRISSAVISALCALLFGLFLGTNARAEDAILKGTINVAAAKTEGFTGLKCDEIIVNVYSKEQTSRLPGYKGIWLLSKPVWERHVKAEGSWTSGSCSYSVKVVAKSEFGVDLTTEAVAHCGGYDTVTSTPGQANSPWAKRRSRTSNSTPWIASRSHNRAPGRGCPPPQSMRASLGVFAPHGDGCSVS